MIDLIKTNIKLNISIKKIILIWSFIIISFLALVLTFNMFDEKNKNIQKINVAIVNDDKSSATKLLIDSFKNTKHFSNLFDLKVLDLKSAKSQFEKGFIDSYVIIPKGFARALMYYENKKINIFTNVNNPTKNKIFISTLKGYSKYVKTTDIATLILNNLMEELNYSSSDYDKMNTMFTLEMLQTTIGRTSYFDVVSVSDLPATTSIDYYMSALPISIVMIISIGYALAYMEKRSRFIYRRMMLTPLSLFKINIIEIISNLITVFVIFIPFILAIAYYKSLFYALRFSLAIFLLYLIYSYVWVIISEFIRDKNIMLLFSINISFLVLLFSGSIVPFVLLPIWIRSIATYIINFKLIRYIQGVNIGISLFFILLLVLSLFTIKILIDDKKYRRIK